MKLRIKRLYRLDRDAAMEPAFVAAKTLYSQPTLESEVVDPIKRKRID
jgi:hypothetical protein